MRSICLPQYDSGKKYCDFAKSFIYFLLNLIGGINTYWLLRLVVVYSKCHSLLVFRERSLTHKIVLCVKEPIKQPIKSVICYIYHRTRWWEGQSGSENFKNSWNKVCILINFTEFFFWIFLSKAFWIWYWREQHNYNVDLNYFSIL